MGDPQVGSCHHSNVIDAIGFRHQWPRQAGPDCPVDLRLWRKQKRATRGHDVPFPQSVSTKCRANWWPQHGLTKLVADAGSRRLLGTQIFAPEGADSIQTATLAIRQGLTIADLADTIFPSLSTVEGLKLAALSFGNVAKLSCCANPGKLTKDRFAAVRRHST